MLRPWIRWAVFLLCSSLSVSAQQPQERYERPPRRVTVDIQVYLPGGGTPNHPIAILLTSDDGRINETVFTKRGGVASISGLEEHARVTLLVPAEEGVYQTTSFDFTVAEGRVVVPLKPYPGASSFAVSVGDLHKPNPKARRLYEKAVKDLERGRVGEAESKLHEAAALDPHYIAPVALVGRIRLRQGKFAEAEKLYQQALEKDPTSVDALTGLGIALSGQGDYRAALAPLEEAGRLAPNHEVHFHLGVALMETGRLDRAEHLLRGLASGSSPLSASSDFALGRLYSLRGDRERGMDSLESFLAKRPHGPVAEAARKSLQQLRQMPPRPN